jgi:C1A family cysteine protease
MRCCLLLLVTVIVSIGATAQENTDYAAAAIPTVTGLKKPANLATSAKKQNIQASRKLTDSGLVSGDAKNGRLQAIAFAGSSLPQLCDPQSAAVDFRQLGGVSPVKSQGACGACWAFATNAALESSYLLRRKASIDASEQELISCSNAGSCGGGWWAFDFHVTPGIEASSSLSYQATDAACPQSIRTDYKAITWGYVDAKGGLPSITELKSAMCQHGPLTVGMFVDPAFQIAMRDQHDPDYVFQTSNQGQVNHAVELVGWDEGKQAWLIKNSWGSQLGSSGFMWVHYGSSSLGDGAAWVEVQPTTIINLGLFKTAKASIQLEGTEAAAKARIAATTKAAAPQ